MIFKNKQRILDDSLLPELKMNNQRITRVSSFLYLGIYLDEDLSWNTHVNYISNKISKINGMLKRLSFILPESILKTVYFALIHPHMIYGLLVWGFNLEKIIRLQKQSMRIITRSHFLAHTTNLFKSMQILKLEDIFISKQINFYHKFINNKLPSALNSILAIQDNSVRSCHSFFFLKPAQKANTETAKQCIRHSIPHLINNFDRTFISDIVNVSEASLKAKFRKKALLNYNFRCEDDHCFPCISRYFNPYGFSSPLCFLHIFYFLRF